MFGAHDRAGPKLVWVALALGIGAAGGAVFNALALPLAWMLGAMCLSTAAALARLPVRVPAGLRTAMIAILGIMLGSIFSPEILSRAGQWLEGLGLLAVYLIATSAIVLVYFRRIGGYDPVTAYFSATPGGLNEMVLVGEAMGGDARVISLTHAVRILVVVLVVPFYFRLIEGYEPPSASGFVVAGSFGLADALVLGLCGLGGYLLAVRLQVPAAPLVGPLVLSAAAHLGGFTDAPPPPALVALAQVVVGTAIGCRFAGLPIARVRRALALAIGSSVLMLGLAGAFSAVAGAVAIAEPAALFLSFAPGGLAEMSLIALSLGIDTAFVATMHIFRIIVVVVGAPLVFRLMRRRWPRA